VPAGRGTGHGKLILCGEHAVVYGHPALAFAVTLSTTVQLHPHAGPTRVDSPHADPRVRDALCTVLPETGVRAQVETQVPVGRGMGSSAALAVAVVRAQHPQLEGQALIDAAMPIERAFHGNPSGLDVAVSALGGGLCFRRGPPMELEPVALGDWHVVVLDSGTPGDTRALVAGVAARRPAIDAHLDRIGALVQEARDVLHDAPALGELLDENHALLQAIGVSTPALDRLVELARGAGALGAKLAGAGGGGVVLALCTDPAPVLDAAAARGIVALAARPAPRHGALP
jgi:mevalonate kinase